MFRRNIGCKITRSRNCNLVVMYHSKLIQRNLFKQTSKITKNRDVGSSLHEPKLIDRVINGGFEMGLYQHVRELWKKPQANMPALWRESLIQWREGDAKGRVERPTRINRGPS